MVFELSLEGRPNYPLQIWMLLRAMDSATFNGFIQLDSVQRANAIIPFLKCFDCVSNVCNCLLAKAQFDLLEQWGNDTRTVIWTRKMLLPSIPTDQGTPEYLVHLFKGLS